MSGLGPTFGAELAAAGLDGLPLAWTSDGHIEGRSRLTGKQNAALDAVIAAHDPLKSLPRAVSTTAILDALTDTEAKVAMDLRARDLLRLVARGSDLIPINNPKIVRLASALGTDAADLFNRLLPT